MHIRQVLIATTALAIAAPTAAAAAQTADTRYSVDLPAGPLDSALFRAAQQTDVQLIFTDPDIARIRVQRINGSFSARQILDLLLARTGYTYRFTGPRSVRVMAVAREQAKLRASALTRAEAQVADGQSQPVPQSLPPAASPESQDAGTATDDQPQTDIVVVGSQIKGSKVTEALPVTRIDESQIRATGAVSGDELFRSIPQMGDVSFNSSYLPNSSNSARGDVGSVNLRNLGAGDTLVLLNGRRVVAHPTSRADDNLVPVLTYNTNAIPVFGLERLEVLLDGAGAIYGSDAVAGVVNTVLKTDYDGAQIEGQTGWAEGTNLAENTLNVLLGKNLGGGRGNITLFGSYDKRTALKADDQDYTASANIVPLFDGTRFAGSTFIDGRSTITPWGSFQTYRNVVVRRGTTSLTNASGQFHIQPGTNSGCAADLGNGICIDDGTNTAAADRNLRFDAPHAFNTDVMPSLKRLNLFLTGHYQITDGLEFFGEAGYYLATTRSVQASTGTLSSGPLVIPASNYWNPFGPITFADGTANPNRLAGINAPAGGVPVTLSSYNFADTGPSIVDVKNTQFRLLGGLRWNFLGFRWESAALYSEARVRDTSDGISQTLLQRQLALSTPDAYNPFNGGNLLDPGGADATSSSLAAINAIKVKTTRVSKSTLAMIDLKGSNSSLIHLPGGDVGLAIGGEVRRETQSDDRDPRVDGTITFTDAISGAVNGSDLIGTSPSPDTHGSRTVAAAYAELAVPVVSPEMNVPLMRSLELQLAGRFEHYSDVGSVAKPKIAAAWDVISGIRLRGSYGEGFKAPNLEQINASVVTRSNTRTDYIRCEAQLRQPTLLPDGVTANPQHIGSFTNCSQSFSTSAQRSGNPDLKPETSTTWSAGVVLEPHFLDNAIGRITFTADYWHIAQKGIVGLLGEGNALINDYLLRVQGKSDPNVIRAAPTADDTALFAGTGIDPVGRVLYVKDQYVNLLPQEAAGIDLGLTWRLPDFGIGKFTLTANAAYLDKFYLQPSPQIQTLLNGRAAGTINAGTTITGGGDLVGQNGKPRWKVSGSLIWDFRQFEIGGYTQYTSELDDTGLFDDVGYWLIKDQITFNLYGQVTVGNPRQGNYRLRIGVRNLTNEGPPLSSSGYLGSVYNPYGRYWYASVRASF